MGFLLDREVLYKKGKDQVLLKCVNSSMANKIIEEIHDGVCGTHANGHKMARQVMRAGYYWSTLKVIASSMPENATSARFILTRFMYLRQSYMSWHHPGLSQCRAWMSLDPYFQKLLTDIDSFSWLLTISRNG